MHLFKNLDNRLDRTGLLNVDIIIDLTAVVMKLSYSVHTNSTGIDSYFNSLLKKALAKIYRKTC